MTTITAAEAKANLSKYMNMAEFGHEEILITKRGKPSVVLIEVEKWETLKEQHATKKDSPFQYTTLDPAKHSYKIDYPIDETVDVSDVQVFKDVDDPATYVRELRAKTRWKK